MIDLQKSNIMFIDICYLDKIESCLIDRHNSICNLQFSKNILFHPKCIYDSKSKTNRISKS